MGKCFDQIDVFPVIADVIRRLHAASGEYVTHEQIVGALLSDSLGSVLVEVGQKNCPEFTRQRLASIMVQWFSQSITVAQSPYRTQFDRRKKDHGWAYKPAPGSATA